LNAQVKTFFGFFGNFYNDNLEGESARALVFLGWSLIKETSPKIDPVFNYIIDIFIGFLKKDVFVFKLAWIAFTMLSNRSEPLIMYIKYSLLYIF
jgi:hypothetical protein